MKNFKILRVCAANPYLNFFNRLYSEEHLDTKPYCFAIERLMEMGYLTPGSWSHVMRLLGNEATDVVPDFPLLQEHWARENLSASSLSEPKALNLTNIFLAQIEHYQPNVIYFERGGFLTISRSLRTKIKSLFPFVNIVTGQWGDELNGNHHYSDFNDLDIIFCTYSALKQDFEKAGIHSELCPLCFDDALGRSINIKEPQDKMYDLIFAGSTGYGVDEHADRYFTLLEIIKKTPLLVWSNENRLSVKNNIIRNITGLLEFFNVKTLKKLLELNIIKQDERLGHIIGYAIRRKQNPTSNIVNWHNYLPLNALYPNRCFSPLFGRDYYALLKKTRVVFNKHRVDKTEYGNIRTFETTGVGSCLLTDRATEASFLFEKDREIVSYESVAEAIEKIAFLRSHEDVRKEIALAGQKRTLRDHTVQNRCQLINNVLENYDKAKTI